jgi:leucyl-tRNA synthetase
MLKLKDKHLAITNWPTFDEAKTIKNIVTIAVSINGKLRGTIDAKLDETEENIMNLAKTNQNVAKFLSESTIKKVVFVKNKILNIVLED